MTILYITCNPYSERPFPKIQFDNGYGQKQSLDSFSSLARFEREPFRKNLNAHDDWAGLFPTIQQEFGVANVRILFIGCIEDYQILKKVAETNKALTIEIVTDEILANKNSPAVRRKCLAKFLNDSHFIFGLLKNKKLFETVTACQKILCKEDISPLTDVLEIKKILDEYFLRHFDTDESFLNAEIQNLLKEAEIENCDKGFLQDLLHCLPRWFRHLPHWLNRAANCIMNTPTLFEFHSKLKHICRNLANTEINNIKSKWIEKLDAEIFTEEFNLNVQEFCQIIEGYLTWHICHNVVNTEINNIKGKWIEKLDAEIFIEEFNLNVQEFCQYIDHNLASIWINNLNDKEFLVHYRLKYDLPPYPPIDRLINDLKNTATEFTISAKVQKGLKKIQPLFLIEQHHVPAYWQGQNARQLVREYIDIGKYESDVLNLVLIEIFNTVSIWQKKLTTIVAENKYTFGAYRLAIHKAVLLINMKFNLRKLRDLTNKLTLLDWEE